MSSESVEDKVNKMAQFIHANDWQKMEGLHNYIIEKMVELNLCRQGCLMTLRILETEIINDALRTISVENRPAAATSPPIKPTTKKRKVKVTK